MDPAMHKLKRLVHRPVEGTIAQFTLELTVASDGSAVAALIVAMNTSQLDTGGDERYELAITGRPQKLLRAVRDQSLQPTVAARSYNHQHLLSGYRDGVQPCPCIRTSSIGHYISSGICGNSGNK